MNNPTNGIIAARTRLKKEEQICRSIALHKFERGIERRRQNRIAGSMIMLIALIIANAWAFKQSWGL